MGRIFGLYRLIISILPIFGPFSEIFSGKDVFRMAKADFRGSVKRGLSEETLRRTYGGRRRRKSDRTGRGMSMRGGYDFRDTFRGFRHTATGFLMRRTASDAGTALAGSRELSGESACLLRRDFRRLFDSAACICRKAFLKTVASEVRERCGPTPGSLEQRRNPRPAGEEGICCITTAENRSANGESPPHDRTGPVCPDTTEPRYSVDEENTAVPEKEATTLREHFESDASIRIRAVAPCLRPAFCMTVQR